MYPVRKERRSYPFPGCQILHNNLSWLHSLLQNVFWMRESCIINDRQRVPRNRKLIENREIKCLFRPGYIYSPHRCKGLNATPLRRALPNLSLHFTFPRISPCCVCSMLNVVVIDWLIKNGESTVQPYISTSHIYVIRYAVAVTSDLIKNGESIVCLWICTSHVYMICHSETVTFFFLKAQVHVL